MNDTHTADTVSIAPTRARATDNPRLAWGVAFVLALLFVLAATLTGCGGIPQEQHDALRAAHASAVKARDAADARYDAMQERYARLDALLAWALERVDALMGDLRKYVTGRKGE